MTWSVLGLVFMAATCHAVWHVAAMKVPGNLAVLWLGLCFASIIGLDHRVGHFGPLMMAKRD